MQQELIDVLNENGVATGEVVTRADVHKRGLWHRAVICAVIDPNNRVLLQQRALNKDKFPGLWDISVAAHVLANEMPMSTVMREFNEEIGMQIGRNVSAKDFFFLSSFRNQMSIGDNLIENQFYDLFVYNLDVVVKFKFNDAEVANTKWAAYSDILKLKTDEKFHPRKEWIAPILKRISML